MELVMNGPSTLPYNNIKGKVLEWFRSVPKFQRNIPTLQNELRTVIPTAFEELYCHAINGLNQTKEILLETPNTEATNKRAIDCLDSYIKALGNIHKKRFEETPTDNCETLSVESASTLDTPSLNVSTSATISIPSSSRGLKRKDQEKNWEFIDEYRTQHGSNMDWEECFSEGKKKGLLRWEPSLSIEHNYDWKIIPYDIIITPLSLLITLVLSIFYPS
ncbi:hypothetical protein EDC94DRAFT_413325 [Helicostylum pulchrum]|nr:hypothetical protein EDC94DRAFT_413325 [Helicostylum pulchrum]